MRPDPSVLWQVVSEDALAQPAIRHALRNGRAPSVLLYCKRGRDGEHHDSGMRVVLAVDPLRLELTRGREASLWMHDGDPRGLHAVGWTCEVCARRHEVQDWELLQLAVKALVTPIRRGNKYVAYVH